MAQLHGLHSLRILCLALLASCSANVPHLDTQQAQTTLTEHAGPPATVPQRYRIDGDASTLHILVYRAGPLARLGHNHVISSNQVGGWIWQGSSLTNSGFDIQVPVNSLVVDDNAARAAEGDDFPLNIPDDAKAGTKVNMLRETLLDGAHYPAVTLQAVHIDGAAPTPTVRVALRIRDQTRQVQVPVQLSATPSALRVQGEFSIQQSDFGITPLSVAMGALQVQDTVHIKFDLLARAE